MDPQHKVKKKKKAPSHPVILCGCLTCDRTEKELVNIVLWEKKTGANWGDNGKEKKTRQKWREKDI